MDLRSALRLGKKGGLLHDSFSYSLLFVFCLSIVVYLLKARTVAREEQPLLGNARKQQ
jgi:hypothetical protein